MLRGMRYGPGSPRPRSRPLVPPGHRPAGHVCQDRLGRHRDLIRDVTLARSSAPRNGGDHRHVGWIDLAAFRDPDSPGQATRAQGLSERGGPITRFGQHAAEAHAPPLPDPVDLRDGDLQLGTGLAPVLGDTGPAHPVRVARSSLGQEQRQADRHRHLAARQRQRHQRLAVGSLAQRRGILRRHPDGAVALLRQRGVVGDQDRIRPADKAIGLAEQRPLQRTLIPDPGRNEVV